jgi:toxin ParE1/3/4
MKRKVIFAPEARDDLFALYSYIAERSGTARAFGYIGRIERYCLGFDVAGERGSRRDDLRPGLRIVGFERRVTIAFHVEPGTVTIDRIFYAGRDVERIFRGDD